MSDRVLVMKDGIAVAQGSADRIFHSPQHAYTQRFLIRAKFRSGAAEKVGPALMIDYTAC